MDEKRNLGVVLGYPTLKNYDYGKGKIDTQQLELMFTILVDCIDHVFEGDKIYPAKDSTKRLIATKLLFLIKNFKYCINYNLIILNWWDTFMSGDATLTK